MFFPPLIEGGTTYWPVTATRIFLVLILLAWFRRSLKDGTITIRKSGLEIPVALFLLLAFFSLLIAPYGYLAAQLFESIVGYAVIFYLFINAIKKKDFKPAFALAASMGVAEALYGTGKYYLSGEARATGTFFNPNFYGGYLAMCAPLLLVFTSRRDLDRKVRLLALAGFLVSGYALLLSQSRGGFLAFAVACLVFLGLRLGWKGALAAVLLVVAVFFLTPSINRRFLHGSDQDKFSYYRLRIWENAAERIVAHPFGEGLLSYQLGSQQHNFEAPEGAVLHSKLAESPHDGYLEVAAEMGLQGLIVLFWGLTALFLIGLRALEDGEYRVYAAGALSGLAAFLSHALVDSNFMEPALVTMAVFLAASLVLVRDFKGVGEVFSLTVYDRPATRYGGSILALLLCAYLTMPLMGWYYFSKFMTGKGCGPVQIDCLKKAIFFAPNDASYHNSLASCYFTTFRRVKDPALAQLGLDEINLAVRFSPKDAYYMTRKAFLLYNLGMCSEGADRERLLRDSYDWYMKASAQNPYYSYNYYDAAKVAGLIGKAGEREALLGKAVSYEPNFLPGRLELAKIYLGQGRKKEALSELRKIKEIMASFSSGDYDILRKYGFQVDAREVDELTRKAQ